MQKQKLLDRIEALNTLIGRSELLEAKVAAEYAKVAKKVKAEQFEIDNLSKQIKEERSSLGKLLDKNGIKTHKTEDYTASLKVTRNVIIEDDDKAMGWVKSQKNITNKDYIRVKESLDKAVFKKFAKLQLAKGVKIEGVKSEEQCTIAFKTN